MNGSKSSSEVIVQFPYPSPKSTLINALCLIGPIVCESRFCKGDVFRVPCKFVISKSMWRESFGMDKVVLKSGQTSLCQSCWSKFKRHRNPPASYRLLALHSWLIGPTCRARFGSKLFPAISDPNCFGSTATTIHPRPTEIPPRS